MFIPPLSLFYSVAEASGPPVAAYVYIYICMYVYVCMYIYI